MTRRRVAGKQIRWAEGEIGGEERPAARSGTGGFASFGWSFDFAQDDGRDGAHVTLTVARRSTATTEADGCPDLPPSAPVSLIPLTLKKAFDAGSRVYLEPSMKIALLHYTFWPEVGGVEHLMRDQANMLCRAGHEVTVITGVGRDTGEDYQVVVLPELAPDHKLNAAVRTLLQSGQSDQNLNKYRALLVKAVGKALGGFDVTIVHNVFTMLSWPMTAITCCRIRPSRRGA
jgi:hypothetical protein